MPGFQILCCVTWFYFARERLSNEMPSMQKTSQACKRDQFLVLLHPCCLSLLISENKGLEKSMYISNRTLHYSLFQASAISNRLVVSKTSGKLSQ